MSASEGCIYEIPNAVKCPVLPVVEEDEVKVPGEDGTEVTIPVNMAGPNPNEVEFDNLYLDMNGIVGVVLAVAAFHMAHSPAGSSLYSPGGKGACSARAAAGLLTLGGRSRPRKPKKK